MELKMFRFGDSPCDWIVAETKEQAIEIYKGNFGEWEFQEYFGDGTDNIEEEPTDKLFTYFHDNATPEKDTFGNLIKKYCDKPDIFATSEF
ncbi:hypothetical protein BpsM61_00031 [Bacillus phage vB_BpsM-61]|nr:hypothetical protein BpsM61_00031 [Bacillus phage vB_BpsM-61]